MQHCIYSCNEIQPCSKIKDTVHPAVSSLEAFSFDESTAKGLDCFTIYRDEIDAHWTGHLPLRNALNLFERARTNYFGGPDELRRLQQEDGIVAVVTGIENCSLIDDGGVCKPGQEVEVESYFVSKRRGMIIECWQTLKSEGVRLAQGKVNLMLLDEKKRRPTTNRNWSSRAHAFVPHHRSR